MEGPPPEFFEALDKYYSNELESAKDLLKGNDTYSKALLALVITKHDSSPEGDKQVKDIIDSLDTAGNDIALMFCVMAKEYSLRFSEAKNLLLKRFGKPLAPEEVEAPEAAEATEAAEAPEAAAPEAPAPEAAAPEAEAVSEAPAPEAPAPEAPAPEAPAPEAPAPEAPEASKQKGGRISKKKRPSKLRKTKRA
jgi:hypothetical protein